jgi:hypothetical protein
MSTTPNLGLPLIAAAQAQKHVTHNEALLALDALVHCAVLDRDRGHPPDTVEAGSRHIVASPASGPWAGREGRIAQWLDSGWIFHEPSPGIVAFVRGEGAFVVFTGAEWSPLAQTLQRFANLTRLGIGTEADEANMFAARLNAALWTALGASDGGTGDLRIALNKETVADTVSLLFQTGYSGRAELGLAGSDRLALKVSADGVAWQEALAVDPADGSLSGARATFQGLATPTLASVDGTERLALNPSGLVPAADGSFDLGKPASRFRTVFATTGTISTSDAREKTTVSPLSAAELAWSRDLAEEIGGFRFLAAVEAKGDAARLHVGLTVQRAVALGRACGLDPFGYAFICRDPAGADDEAGSRYGFRPDQLALFLLRGQHERLKALETAL